jgi:hypothetical protein
MDPYRMQTGIADDDLKAISGGWVANNDGVDFVEKRIKHRLILTGKD